MHVQQLLKRAALALLLSLCFAGVSHAQSCASSVCNAASPSQAAVLAALPNGSAPATVVVNVPAGSATWSTGSGISYTVPANVTNLSIIFAGNLNCPSACDDQTTITDNITRGGGCSPDPSMLAINTGNAASFLRISGLTVKQTPGNPTCNGFIRIAGRSTHVRFDHVHFPITNSTSSHVLLFNGCLNGVADHNMFDATGSGSLTDAQVSFEFCGSSTNGDYDWTQPSTLGSSNAFFFENNTFQEGIPEDCRFVGGGRIVMRYNTINIPTPPGGGFQNHATGSNGRARGCRIMEIYNNTLTSGTSPAKAFNVVFFDSGTGVIHDNVSTNYQQDVHFVNDRGGTDIEPYTQTPTPNGWGYMGTRFNGTGSAWDTSAVTSSGYRGLDQVGSGAGDLLSGSFPSVVNTALGNIIAYPREALEPVYIWNENCNGCGTFSSTNDPSGSITQDRDWYQQCGQNTSTCPGPFNGSVGVGTGPFAARPIPCTAGAGNTPGVGYWDTTNNELWVCTVTGNPGTWTVYYTPYTYPHPLVGGVTPPPPPPVAPAAVMLASGTKIASGTELP
jgi:hypothetical protein